ncbi:aldehyde dehydrogenase family protein [Amycolatopsis sp. DSM 110486]|uniref:aldehyde dehydrogenase family protein n=1 Tax=Amycolatopsis sp. DSM 110486 TaxID=2865832 RepID=UPI001C6A74EB|nr:aldehyde dehydrogenase family protein [Amycolatopsis sp. DSM 110486]QYN18103.1 aldehyde dehydrogenase family protein [Amycolatopsis sp. DSM 110486]
MRSQDLFINGQRVSREATAEVRSPWDGLLVGTYAMGGTEDATAAVTAAHHALAEGLPPHRRAEVLGAAARLVGERAEEFARLLLLEAGKPITAARGEVQRAITTLQLSADEARRLPSESVQMDAFPSGDGMFAFTVAEPLGVVAAITPFNFPLNLVAHKIGPALAAGCPVVLKPSERTPLTAGLLVEVLADAGLPAGWLNLVTGDPAQIVKAWQEDERVAVVSFTGSAAVGWQIKAGSPHKHHILELGSNTAMVVDADADLDRAVAAAVASGYGFSGQACVSLQRLYVHEDVVDDVVAKLGAAVTALAVGDPADEKTVVGPLISGQATDRVMEWVQGAVSEGARVVAGGALRDGVLEPTVVTDVRADSALLCSEVFGPVVTVVPVKDVAEAIAAANDSRFGLNTAIFTNDLTNALQYAKKAEAGSVLVNVAPAFRADHMPYRGVKESGHGREGVKYAVASLVAEKLVILAA